MVMSEEIRSEIQQIEAYLTGLGWSFVAKCNCGGRYQKKYNKGNYRLVYMPTRRQFIILKNNIRITRLDDSIDNLEQVLQEHGLTD